MVAIAACVWQRRRVASFCLDRALPTLRDVAQLVVASFDCAVGTISQQEIIETFGLALCATMLVWQANVWRSASPWSIFGVDSGR